MRGDARIAGTSTGWWGMVLALLVLSSMLSTMLFAYPYLGAGAERWGPETAPPLGWAALAGALAIGSGVPTVAMHRAAGRRSARAVAVAGAVTAALGVAFVLAALGDLAASGASATEDAYGSVRVVSVVFHLVVAAAGILLLLGVPFRLWAAELGPRQRTAAVCAALLWYYVIGGWLAVSAMVHLLPLLS
ncbi:hypothetical protein BH23ACT9_BH23ACT9_30980 [soil metagenome]